MKIDKRVIAAIIAVVGYVKYKKFEDFINTLQIGLVVNKIENGYAVVSISNENTRHIPYHFSSVDLIIDKTIHVATNTEETTNLSIVPFSQIPINFKLLQAVTLEDLQKSEIVIKYCFYGFEFERLYKPTIKGITIDPDNNNHTHCGCKK